MDIERYARGTWLGPGLVRFASATGAVLTAAAVLSLALTARGTVDGLGRPLGTDFTSFWSAGRLAIEGRAAAAYDWTVLRDAQHQLHGVDAFYPWSYPPVFLLAAVALACLPYLPALALWQGATLALALATAWRALPRRPALLAAVGSPVVFLCLGHGQTAFLSAALLTAGALALPRRPLLAGCLLGLLCYKPQLGLLIPVALAAGGHWRAVGAAAATVAVLVAATIALWGVPAWTAFLESLPVVSRAVLDRDGTGYQKFQSLFTALRLWGVAPPLAYVAQGALAVAAAAACADVWRRPVDGRLKVATLLVGSLLATPYLLDYDLVVLGMACLCLAAVGLESGFRRWEGTILAVAWFVPGAARGIAGLAGIPAGLLVLLAVFWLILSRARSESRAGSGGGARRGRAVPEVSPRRPPRSAPPQGSTA